MTSQVSDPIGDFLGDPQTHGGAEVSQVETHISRIFLAGDKAWKIKKPMTFPFLDFSTLEKRKTFCEQEITLNRRTAPDLYIGLHAITRDASGTLAIDGNGETVEWAIEMARFDESTLFDKLAAADKLDRKLLEQLAAEIAVFHAVAEPVYQDGLGGAKGLKDVIDGNTQMMRDFPQFLDDGKVTALQAASARALEAQAAILDQRQREGLVRRCHGDLHLRNICLVDGAPTVFDAIEFNDDFSCIDMLYDLAFLLMDLDFRGLADAANLIFNRYMDITGDINGIGALPLMMATRAGIRSKVGALTAAQFAEKDAGPVVAEARAYLDAAVHYLQESTPRLIAVGGLSGSGKSRLARSLAPIIGATPGALVLRTDAIRKRLMGVAPLDRLGSDGYAPTVTEKVYETLEQEAAQALALGRPVIADAVFARPDQRNRLRALAERQNLPFQGLWCAAAPEIMAERISSRKNNISDADTQVLQKQLALDLGPLDWAPIDTSGSREQTDAAAREVLSL
ncbi:MAG: AAA family ATPase [Magnetospiraceae bacterium]